MRCFKCQRFGHGQHACRGRLKCARCGQFDHDSKSCQPDMACINCQGKHCAFSRECPKWKAEKQVQQITVENQLSFPEARRIVETTVAVVVSKSYAAAAAVSTASVSVQTDVAWPNNMTLVSKISQVQKHRTKVTKQQASKASQVSLDFVNTSKYPSASKPGMSKPSSVQQIIAVHDV